MAIADVGSWLRALLRVSEERRRFLLGEIEGGSIPTAVYYVLLGASELIAAFGLITDSAMTLIGANVVAPLMMPIFGVALGLARGDFRLLRNALLAEFGGATLGIALTFLLGLLPLAQDVTPTLLAQTRPTLIDLLVAAVAGLAGCLAMIDERMSPALPGVAIATALNPPIAAIGICLAFGAYEGAWGAFLLFFANFLAILGVGGAVFLAAGFITRAEFGTVGGVARRFAGAAIGFVLVAALLTGHLVALIREARTTRLVTGVLDAELAQEAGTALTQLVLDRRDDKLAVLAVLRAPRVLSPPRVKAIEEALHARLQEPVELFMRVVLSKDVAASGSTSLLPHLSLDGTFTRATLAPDVELLQQSEQVLRELIANRPDVALNEVSMVRLPSGPVVVTSIESARLPRSAVVQRAEDALRSRLHQPALRLVVRSVASTDVTSKGQILFGQAHFGELSEADAEVQRRIEAAVRAELATLQTDVVAAVDAMLAGDHWKVRAAVVGARVPAPAEVRSAAQRVERATGQKIDLSIWMRSEVVVTDRGMMPVGEPGAAESD